MILYLGFGCMKTLDLEIVPKHRAVYDHKYIPSKLFMSLLQGNDYKVFRQARPMGKLQAFILHLHYDM